MYECVCSITCSRLCASSMASSTTQSASSLACASPTNASCSAVGQKCFVETLCVVWGGMKASDPMLTNLVRV